MTAYFRDGTPMRKWHRVLWTHIYHWSFTKAQAREAIEINPYLAQHKDDFEKVFAEAHFTPDIWERKWAIKAYAEWVTERKYKTGAKR